MQLTGHGLQHIQDRTALLAKDVLSIISGGAVVNLGSTQGYEYLLFYSPSDKACKIAVMSEGRTHLVSVWNADFALSRGIRRVTRQREAQARKKLRTFIFHRATGGALQAPPKPKKTKKKLRKPKTQEQSVPVVLDSSTLTQTQDVQDSVSADKPEHLEVRVEIWIGNYAQYSLEGGVIVWRDRKHLEPVLNSLREQLEVVVDVIQNNPDKVDGSVGYMINLYKPGTNTPLLKYWVPHWRMKNRLKTAVS